MAFSPKTAEILRSIGWSASYRGDMEKYRQHFQNRGRVMPNKAAEFLSLYGGLNFDRDHPDFVGRGFEFDPLNAGYYEDDTLRQFTQAVGSLVVPIGTSIGGIDYLMDEHGKVYADFDQPEIYLVGNNAEEAIESLCQRSPFLATIPIDRTRLFGGG